VIIRAEFVLPLEKKGRVRGPPYEEGFEEVYEALTKITGILVQAHQPDHHRGDEAAADEVEQKGLNCAVHTMHIGFL
jgi:hypothetical protein